jgi:hypothetical protein
LRKIYSKSLDTPETPDIVVRTTLPDAAVSGSLFAGARLRQVTDLGNALRHQLARLASGDVPLSGFTRHLAGVLIR